MIVADILGGLGNQLFCYAATKAIALDLGYEYRYYVAEFSQFNVANPICNHEGSYIDQFGQEYNRYFERAFNIDIKERIFEIPKNINSKWTWNRSCITNFDDSVYKISDNTHLSGFYIHPNYFAHRRREVLQWFRFQDYFLDKCRDKLDRIIRTTGATHVVSIHMRGGLGLRLTRGTLDSSYYKNAIKRAIDEFSNEKLCLILFSDDPKKAVRIFKNENDVVLHSGTMFEDLCLMTLCDSHIVVNSTFSWWGAWLSDQSKGVIIRPSIWPASNKGTFAPLDMFPPEWIVVNAIKEKPTPMIIMQRIRDEYSPWAVDDPCVAYIDIWYNKYIRRPFRNLIKGLKKRLDKKPIIKWMTKLTKQIRSFLL
jgi:hypothetical protein